MFIEYRIRFETGGVSVTHRLGGKCGGGSVTLPAAGDIGKELGATLADTLAQKASGDADPFCPGRVTGTMFCPEICGQSSAVPF